MLRMFLYVMAATLAIASPAFAGVANCDNCKLLKHGVHRPVIPTPDVVCFWFVQPKPGNVLLKLYLKDGEERPYTKNARTHDRICVGREWVKQMTTKSFICDYENHFDYGEPVMIWALLKKVWNSRGVEACLYGRQKCRKMGYPVYQ